MLVLTRSTGEAVLVDPHYRLEVLGCAEGVATVELTDQLCDRRPDRRRLFKLRPEQGFNLPTPDAPDGGCEVLCCSVGDQKVRLGFRAPREVVILREEVAQRDTEQVLLHDPDAPDGAREVTVTPQEVERRTDLARCSDCGTAWQATELYDEDGDTVCEICRDDRAAADWAAADRAIGTGNLPAADREGVSR